MVAPQLIRQFDTFGGVDINTVDKLRSIEERGNNAVSDAEFNVNFIKSLSNLAGVRKAVKK